MALKSLKTLKKRPLLLVLALVLAGCGGPGRDVSLSTANALVAEDAQEAQIAALAARINALGPNVDPREAARVARIAFEDPLQWARDWGITDPPLIHNIKVNSGARPRGLCKDWADDLQRRMAREQVRTLDWHRAIANHTNLLIEHSTLIVSAKGAAMQDGIVLDPWRNGYGRLYWVAVTEDPKYVWVPRQQVFADKRRRAAERALRTARR